VTIFRESYNRTAAAWGRFIGLSIHCRKTDQVTWTPRQWLPCFHLTIFSGIRRALSKNIKMVDIPPTEVSNSSFLFHQEWSCLELHIV
jgi:hypothetical protein